MKRVVVTGLGAVSPLGSTETEIFSALQRKVSGITFVEEWKEYEGLRSIKAAPASFFTYPSHYSRKALRTMGRVSVLAVRATELALEDASITLEKVDRGSVGVAYGSCLGSAEGLTSLGAQCARKVFRGNPASLFLQSMSHTCAANVAFFFGVEGRVIPTCSACTSASQAIGFSFETIRSGTQKIMFAGGAEELNIAIAALFDTMGATSMSKNEDGSAAPVRPFDRERDGIVVGEGAATLVLEEREHALSRGAKIYGEIIGFGTNVSSTHFTQPNPSLMIRVMKEALATAEIEASAVDLIHAHATGTSLGDLAEAEAISSVFSTKPLVTATKGYLGHTLGACGAIESSIVLWASQREWIPPIVGLTVPDPVMPPLSWVQGGGVEGKSNIMMVNNFAFGGVNTSLLFAKRE